MLLVSTRDGHPFMDDKVPFNDIKDYALALARGCFMELMTGRGTNESSLKMLSFNFERSYLFQSEDSDEMKEEVEDLIKEYDDAWDDHYYGDEDDEDDDEDDEDYEDEEEDPYLVTFMQEQVFGVVLYHLIDDGDEYKIVVTAIHRKYKQAIKIEKDLLKRNTPFEIEEIDYDEIDEVLEPILSEFDLD